MEKRMVNASACIEPDAIGVGYFKVPNLFLWYYGRKTGLVLTLSGLSDKLLAPIAEYRQGDILRLTKLFLADIALSPFSNQILQGSNIVTWTFGVFHGYLICQQR